MRWRALAGIAAPASFVGAWAVSGAVTDGYSPVRDHISDLAAIGAPTRPLMTAGFLGFGLFAPIFATTLPARPRAALTAAGLGTLGVAAAPLGASFGDGAHVATAAVAYVGTASALLLSGQRTLGLACAALLVGSTLGGPDGALQRSGLGVLDAWMVVTAVRQLRQPSRP